MQDTKTTQAQQASNQTNTQQGRKQYVKPEMTEQKPLERATTTVYYFYE